MALSRSRRALLKAFSGRPRSNKVPFRPPWALSEAAFTTTCTRCGDCVKACPEGIIAAGDGGFPEVSFARGECTFCGDCATACGPKALARREGARPWALIARIDGQRCLSVQGVTCRACGDRCEVGAIRFELAVGGIAFVDVNQGICTGCGACFEPCPADAIEMVIDPLNFTAT